MYKIGDKVQIKKNLSVKDGTIKCSITEEMERFRGKKAEIKRVNIRQGKRFYLIDVDYMYWTWVDEFFEPRKERNEI